MDQRASIIAVTAELLTASVGAEVSTRAICEAAGVQQPVLYRLFGDKDGLLSATVDFAFEEYLESKRRAKPSADPVADIRRGWDAHNDFAFANPNAYQLMFGPGLKRRPQSVLAAHELLRSLVDRAGRAGRLMIDPAVATQAIMAANTGVALSFITRPEIYVDRSISIQLREILFAGIFSDPGPVDVSPLAAAAATIVATLDSDPPLLLSVGERVLLGEWMKRL